MAKLKRTVLGKKSLGSIKKLGVKKPAVTKKGLKSTLQHNASKESSKYKSNRTNSSIPFKGTKGKKVTNGDTVKEKENGDESDFEVAANENTTKGSKLSQQKNVDLNCDVDEKDVDTRKLVHDQNKKQKQKRSGGFQSMGLSYPVYKGVMKKGYKIPTPIQRKTIALIMDGKDVVAMARTGSGKTGAFLIPMLEKLNVHSSEATRAIVLSPTRELALQTAKFTHELGKFTDLKSSLIVGGDSMENQFAALHKNPDILIATPGRLLHVLVEMDIKQLSGIEYVVFDEADRLFEMGFAEQLRELMQRFPAARQTVLFSATLPKVLVDFAAAGLTDPTLIRLDVDTKISDKLKTSFFFMRDEDKTACLLHFLQNVIKPDELTVVFVSTRHHVDFLYELLETSGLKSTFIYSSLDQSARKLNLSKFRSKAANILIVTDIAARGIDVPMLDNVINFDFPPKPKIFVHRVGRVARAGRAGTAYSFFVKEELPFVFDLHLFLGRPMKYASTSTNDDDGIIGVVPQTVIVNDLDYVRNKIERNSSLIAAQKVMKNGYKAYVRTREAASAESHKRAKEIDTSIIAMHPSLKGSTTDTNDMHSKLLLDLQKFKPSITVFESITTKKNKEAEQVMQQKRKQHSKIIEREQLKQKETPVIIAQTKKTNVTVIADDKYIASSFNLPEKVIKDEHFISHHPKDVHQEQGFSLTSFEKEAGKVSMELNNDEADSLKQDKAGKKWDRKRKKFVGVESVHAKKFKTESGNYIPKSYKTDIYKDWIKSNHMGNKNGDENGDEDGDGDKSKVTRFQNRNMEKFTKGKKRKNNGGGPKNGKRTLKSKDQIIRSRLKEDLMNNIRKKSKKGSQGKSSGATNRPIKPRKQK